MPGHLPNHMWQVCGVSSDTINTSLPNGGRPNNNGKACVTNVPSPPKKSTRSPPDRNQLEKFVLWETAPLPLARCVDELFVRHAFWRLAIVMIITIIIIFAASVCSSVGRVFFRSRRRRIQLAYNRRHLNIHAVRPEFKY